MFLYRMTQRILALQQQPTKRMCKGEYSSFYRMIIDDFSSNANIW